jgi:hypothetical protein
MKHRTQHSMIDPDAPTSALEFEFEDHDDVPELHDDTYVIGANGDIIKEGSDQAASQSQETTKRWAKPAAFVLVALFVVLTCWNVVRFVQGPPLPPKPSPFQSKQALYLGVMKLDAYRRVHGVVPDSLKDAGLPEAEGYTYERVNPTRYVLTFRNGGSKLEYDSSEPKEQFFGSPKDMLNMGDSK